MKRYSGFLHDQEIQKRQKIWFWTINLEFLQMDSLNAIWHILHISTHTQQLKQAGPKPSPGRAGFFEVSCLGYSLNQIDPQNPQDAQNRYQAFFFLLLFGEIFSQKAQLYYNITYICVCVFYVLYCIDFHFCGKALELLCQHRDYLKQVVSFSA